MGREQRRALTILLLLFAPTSALAASAEVELGSPFTQLAVTASISENFSIGGRAQLLDAKALRVGPALEHRGLSWGPLALTTELLLARSFGFSVVGTFEAQLTESIAWCLDDHSTAIARLGVIGYVGPSRSQTGVVGLATIGVETRLDPAWALGFELGWLASPHDDRPQGGIRLRRSF